MDVPRPNNERKQQCHCARRRRLVSAPPRHKPLRHRSDDVTNSRTDSSSRVDFCRTMNATVLKCSKTKQYETDCSGSTAASFSRNQLSSLLRLFFLLLATCCYTPTVLALPKPCTKTGPFDLLAHALSDTSSFSNGVEIVNVNGVKGYRFTSPARLAGVDSEDIFVHCDRFPGEFSIVVSYYRMTSSSTNEFIMTLLGPDHTSILLALRMRSTRLYLDYLAGGELRSVSVKDPRFSDGNWHTLVVTVTRNEARITVDCGPAQARSLTEPFPRRMNVKRTRIYVASRRKRNKQFSGLLRQLVFYPGEDASQQLCPSTNPTLPQTAAPLIVLESDKQDVRCSLASKGTLKYTKHHTMEICTGINFQQVRGGRERMDYIIDYDDITINDTISMEWFEIEGEGTFLATANKDFPYSALFKWDGRRFEVFQMFKAQLAVHWNAFKMGFDNFLAMSTGFNSERPRSGKVRIFRWSRKRKKFVHFQVIESEDARNTAFFSIRGRHFLAVVNYERIRGFSATSVIYQFDPSLGPRGKFEKYQELATRGAVEVTHFEVAAGPSVFSCLAIANVFYAGSSRVASSIYCWQPDIGQFIKVQDIVTYGATDWEFFQIGTRSFLAVANSLNSSISNKLNATRINSVIYELNIAEQSFQPYQEILTYNAYDWEFFTIGDQYFLSATSTNTPGGGIPNLYIYRWKGYERFVLEHTIPIDTSLDVDYIRINGEHYIASAHPGHATTSTKLFKIITY